MGGSSAEPCRYLNPDELVLRTRQDFAGADYGQFEPEQIETFLREKVIGVHRKGYDVLFVDTDADSPDPSSSSLNPLTVACMNSPQTVGVMPEYFYPELRDNAGLLSSSMRRYQDGPLSNGTGRKLRFAAAIESACAESGKTVVVADIANKPSYLVTNAALTQSPTLLASVLYPFTQSSLITGVAIAGSMTWLGVKNYVMAHGKGVHNPNKILQYEDLIPDFEQARRLRVAQALTQITDGQLIELPVTDDPRIVALYPRAHGMRIADKLVHPRAGRNKVQAIAYSALAPWLETSVRVYTESTSTVSKEGRGPRGWLRVSADS